MRPPPPSPSPPPPASGSHSSGHHPPPSPSPPPPEATELVAFDDLGGGFESLKPTDLAEDGDDADVQHAIILTIVLAVLIVIFLAWRACKRCQARKEQSLPQLDGLEELRPPRILGLATTSASVAWWRWVGQNFDSCVVFTEQRFPSVLFLPRHRSALGAISTNAPPVRRETPTCAA